MCLKATVEHREYGGAATVRAQPALCPRRHASATECLVGRAQSDSSELNQHAGSQSSDDRAAQAAF